MKLMPGGAAKGSRWRGDRRYGIVIRVWFALPSISAGELHGGAALALRGPGVVQIRNPLPYYAIKRESVV
jgi:hypothetical protein